MDVLIGLTDTVQWFTKLTFLCTHPGAVLKNNLSSLATHFCGIFRANILMPWAPTPRGTDLGLT